MPEINIKTRFIKLRQEADEIRSLIAAEKGKHRPPIQPPVIVTADKFISPELQEKHRIFQMQAEETRHILKNEIGRSVSEIKCRILNRRLQRIESELEQLKCPSV
jgi:hypothetical protein